LTFFLPFRRRICEEYLAYSILGLSYLHATKHPNSICIPLLFLFSQTILRCSLTCTEVHTMCYMSLSYEDDTVLLVAMFLQRGKMAHINTTHKEARFVSPYFLLVILHLFQSNMAARILKFYCIRYYKPF
jgi:hypothetical protein